MEINTDTGPIEKPNSTVFDLGFSLFAYISQTLNFTHVCQ